MKKWRCNVCGYEHEGEVPPDACPICGVGPEEFTLIINAIVQTANAADSITTQSALEAIGYGLYVVTSRDGEKINGQCANTVFQLTSKPNRIAVCLNKGNLTHEYVMASGVCAVSILRQDSIDMVKHFGFRSGRTVDKFKDIEVVFGENGCPALKNCAAYIEGKILTDKTTDVGTHTLFVADVTAGRVVDKTVPLTYAFYRSHK